jgi:hypothetical protein
MATKLPEGKQLEERARQLGIDVRGDLIFQSSIGRQPIAPDYELQRRVIEAERAKREKWLWFLALISALASLVSACAAWLAVARKGP